MLKRFKQRLREIAVNVVVMLLGCGVALILTELASHIFIPSYLVAPHPRGLYSNDPDLGYVLSKNFDGRHQHPNYDVTIHTNSDGFRGDEIAPKSANMFRILVLGDSIAWGYGVNAQDSFPERLENFLEQNTDGNVQVINAAVPGYGTDQELALLKKKGLDYRPDLIIVGFFIENDFYDNLIGKGSRVVQEGYLVDLYRYERNKQANPLTSATTWLSQNSRLYTLLRSFFRDWQVRQGKISAEFQPESFPGFADSKRMPIFANIYGPEMEHGVLMTKQILKEIVTVGKEYQAQTMIVLFPSKIQVYPKLWQDVQEIYALDKHNYSLDKPNHILLEFGTQEGILVLDLLPAFYEAGQDTELYFRNDFHQNAAGQSLAAQQVYQAIIAQRLLVQR